MNFRMIYLILFIFFCLTYDLHAKKLALVIGNANYKYGNIKSSINDANELGVALQKCGFEVVSKTDVSRSEIMTVLNQFKNSISSNDVVLFYYVGHAIQVNKNNKLIMIEADTVDIIDVDDISVDLEEIIDFMLGAKMRILILDASKKNPFHDYYINKENHILSKKILQFSTGHPECGLADKDAPIRTYIAYSTASGKFSCDVDGHNGIYTKHILNNILKTGFKLEDVFKLVRGGVYTETNGLQLPWENSSILEKFYFVEPETVNKYIKDNNTFVPAF